MQTTGNLGLRKPEADDTADIADLNYNANILDERIGAVPSGSANNLQSRTAAMEGRYSGGVLKIANGGTAMTDNPSMLTNLGSTSAANVFQSSPRPGVTGTLPIASGGTGQTTAAGVRNTLGLGNTTGALPIANGGTGQTTVASARNALGLGNTTGALPIANGGTGQTTAAAARNALGLGNTTGALPIANGGTGTTSVSGIRSALGIGVVATKSAEDGTLNSLVSENGMMWLVMAGRVTTDQGGMWVLWKYNGTVGGTAIDEDSLIHLDYNNNGNVIVTYNGSGVGVYIAAIRVK